MKSQNLFLVWFRIILGLFLIVYALNQFLHFLPTSYGTMPENTRDFIDAVAPYLPYLYMFEILIGILLLINKWTAFIIIVLFPLTIAFLIFNLSNNDISKIWPALIVAFLNIALVLSNKKKYIPLFE
ncbi:DoxX protein [Snuella sedimenti]|uniref:DoxX protein n=1 Tax=Snuella sedimenti TaxID=2798802 RepID=A0A8J7IU06_9FLAO|nr:DoxX protein [Snuella sedimenti]MBJ6366565.1 DoxX protein [Snuella sedimenti]